MSARPAIFGFPFHCQHPNINLHPAHGPASGTVAGATTTSIILATAHVEFYTLSYLLICLS